MATVGQEMLVFRKGRWMTVDLGFLADPGLSEGQRRIGAAVAGAAMARGRTKAAAQAAAEQAVYLSAYPGLEYRIAGKEHDAPKH